MKLFFITGHGRSGTNYMASLFQYLGYEVGAQTGGKDGQSHNYPPEWPLHHLKKNYKYLIQVVRTPQLVVESVFRAKYSLPKQNTQRIKEIGAGESPVSMEEAIHSVVLWNQAIKAAAPDLVVKVEEAPEACAGWLAQLDLTRPTSGELPPTDINARASGGWDLARPAEWSAIAPELMAMYREHCKEYGYDDEIVVHDDPR